MIKSWPLPLRLNGSCKRLECMHAHTRTCRLRMHANSRAGATTFCTCGECLKKRRRRLHDKRSESCLPSLWLQSSCSIAAAGGGCTGRACVAALGLRACFACGLTYADSYAFKCNKPPLPSGFWVAKGVARREQRLQPLRCGPGGGRQGSRSAELLSTAVRSLACCLAAWPGHKAFCKERQAARAAAGGGGQ